MTEAQLYDEFFEWLDTRVRDIVIPTLFPELPGFKLTASDFLAEHKRIAEVNGKPDYYCDALYDLWFTAKTVKEAENKKKQAEKSIKDGKIPC